MGDNSSQALRLDLYQPEDDVAVALAGATQGVELAASAPMPDSAVKETHAEDD